jgi:hypothetical protein
MLAVMTCSNWQKETEMTLSKAQTTFILRSSDNDRFCGLVARVSSYRSRGPGFDSRPYQIFWNGVHSASWGQLRSYLNENIAAPVSKTEIKGRGNSLS